MWGAWSNWSERKLKILTVWNLVLHIWGENWPFLHHMQKTWEAFAHRFLGKHLLTGSLGSIYSQVPREAFTHRFPPSESDPVNFPVAELEGKDDVRICSLVCVFHGLYCPPTAHFRYGSLSHFIGWLTSTLPSRDIMTSTVVQSNWL